MNPNPRSSQLYFVSHTLLQKSEGAWFMTRGWYTDFKNPPVIPPPAISTESVSLDLESQLADHPPEDVARTLGAIVAKASGAEGMIVRADAFAWLGSPLTPDRLADSYVSASETLGFHSLTGNQITEILAADPGLVLAGLDNLQLAPARAYSIISPISPLVRHDALKNPTSATGPVYKYLLRGMDITTWE